MDAATNAAWRTGMRTSAPRLAPRQRSGRDRLQRTHHGDRDPSKRIGRGHEYDPTAAHHSNRALVGAVGNERTRRRRTRRAERTRDVSTYGAVTPARRGPRSHASADAPLRQYSVPYLGESRALARTIRTACVGQSRSGSHRVVGTLQSGSALFMRFIDAGTNAAWRTGMRSCTPRHALRYRAACSRPHRKRYGPTSRQIGHDHICEMISRAPRTPCQNKQSDLQDEYRRACTGQHGF